MEKLEMMNQQEDEVSLSNEELSESDIHLGLYGRQRLEYLKEYKEETYKEYVKDKTIMRHCKEVDEEVRERLHQLIPQMAKAEGVNEELKAKDMLGWVGRMNNIKSRALEIILPETVYR